MIYFLQPVDGGPVKIGTTENLDARVKQLEAHYGCPLALLGTMPGGREEERSVHERFGHLRFGRTEQFQPAADLMAFIDRPLLVGANPDAVEAMGVVRPTVMVRIDSDLFAKVRFLASVRNVSISDFLSDILRPIVDKEFQKAVKALLDECDDEA
jgi:hypothetical protein